MALNILGFSDDDALAPIVKPGSDFAPHIGARGADVV
jgi:hypothetical protein